LVTAKHVIENVGTRKAFIRINKTNGEGILTEFKQDSWFFHPDNDKNPVDVAVAIAPYEEGFDVKAIPISIFLKPSELLAGKYGVGDDVFITGLFSQHFGQEKNLPIVRTGNIAMIPEEKVDVSWNGGQKIEAYLIEARSIGGISGSPVFFRAPNNRGSLLLVGEGPFCLAGLIHGHWAVGKENFDNLPDEDLVKSQERLNMGIAIVTPAQKILETLNHPSLVRNRERTEQALKLVKPNKPNTRPI
jgi:hypothetical protein